MPERIPYAREPQKLPADSADQKSTQLLILILTSPALISRGVARGRSQPLRWSIRMGFGVRPNQDCEIDIPPEARDLAVVSEVVPTYERGYGMIPQIIHYVWVGCPFPDKYKGYVDSWRETNPDYRLICWNEDNIDFTVPAIEHQYKAKKYNKVSDLVRHKAILEMGGIYLDTDFQVYKPLDRLLRERCFYGFQHKSHPTDWVAPGALGAEPGHWFIRRVWERMLTARNTIVGIDIPTAIGPKLITSMLRKEGLDHYSDQGVYVKDVFICPTHWFYPFSYSEEFTPECVREETFAAHFWEKSWEKNVSLPTRVARGLKGMVRRS